MPQTKTKRGERKKRREREKNKHGQPAQQIKSSYSLWHLPMAAAKRTAARRAAAPAWRRRRLVRLRQLTAPIIVRGGRRARTHGGLALGRRHCTPAAPAAAQRLYLRPVPEARSLASNGDKRNRQQAAGGRWPCDLKVNCDPILATLQARGCAGGRACAPVSLWQSQSAGRGRSRLTGLTGRPLAHTLLREREREM